MSLNITVPCNDVVNKLIFRFVYWFMALIMNVQELPEDSSEILILFSKDNITADRFRMALGWINHKILDELSFKTITAVSWLCMSQGERVHGRAGTVTAVQSVCLSGYKSMTACMLHYGFNRSIEWQVAVCASCSLSHSHIRDSTHMQSVSFSDSLSVSPVTCAAH